MAREEGTFNFSANFEVKKKGTIDARQLVDDFSDLLNFTSDNYISNGFPVAVKQSVEIEGEEYPRGIYQCIDENNLDLPASWELVSGSSSGSTTTINSNEVKIIYLPAVTSLGNLTVNQAIANQVNNHSPFNLTKQNIVRFSILIENVVYIAEIVRRPNEGLYGNDPEAIQLNFKNILIIDRYQATAGTIGGDENAETIIINPDGANEPQDISPETSIEAYVNANGPYTVQSLDDGNTRFVVNIAGEIINYFYNGNTGQVGGTGYTTQTNDFIEINPDTNTTAVQTLQNVVDAQADVTTAKFKTGVLLEDKPLEALFAFILGSNFFGFRDGDFYINAPFKFQESTSADENKILQFDENGRIVKQDLPDLEGDSAYQVWLNQGNTGTEQDFFNSLEGPQGPQGQPGQDLEPYSSITITASRNILDTDRGKTLIIDGTVTLTFSGTYTSDLNFNILVKAGGSLTIANGDKTLLDGEQNTQTQIVVDEKVFATVLEFASNQYITLGL